MQVTGLKILGLTSQCVWNGMQVFSSNVDRKPAEWF